MSSFFLFHFLFFPLKKIIRKKLKKREGVLSTVEPNRQAGRERYGDVVKKGFGGGHFATM
jgi:hypothetical protein